MFVQHHRCRHRCRGVCVWWQSGRHPSLLLSQSIVMRARITSACGWAKVKLARAPKGWISGFRLKFTHSQCGNAWIRDRETRVKLHKEEYQSMACVVWCRYWNTHTLAACEYVRMCDGPPATHTTRHSSAGSCLFVSAVAHFTFLCYVLLMITHSLTFVCRFLLLLLLLPPTCALCLNFKWICKLCKEEEEVEKTTQHDCKQINGEKC